MALLNDANRISVWEQLMRENKEEWGALLKMDIRAAVDASDQWNEDNAASFNAALPQPFRSTATTKQKAMLHILTVAKRYGVL